MTLKTAFLVLATITALLSAWFWYQATRTMGRTPTTIAAETIHGKTTDTYATAQRQARMNSIAAAFAAATAILQVAAGWAPC